jgi:hypothetical protein
MVHLSPRQLDRLRQDGPRAFWPSDLWLALAWS